jgi:hypothetical protein
VPRFRVSGFGFRVSGFGFRVSGFGFRVSGFGFRVSGFGFRVSGFGFRVSGSLRLPHAGLNPKLETLNPSLCSVYSGYGESVLSILAMRHISKTICLVASSILLICLVASSYDTYKQDM